MNRPSHYPIRLATEARAPARGFDLPPARALASLLAFLAFAALPGARAAQIDLAGPPGSGSFGTTVTVLPNGNFVVTDPGYDAPGPIADVGAVYLYDGVTLAVISTLTGSTANDQVGSGGVTVLSNGNYVVRSPNWDNGAATNAGAVTWGSGTKGLSGAVSAANSLVGTAAHDQEGSGNGVTALNNGNYVVRCPFWNNGAVVDAGAVTWGSGATGVTGAVSAANSLVGSATSDRVGYFGVTALNNGNFVVSSRVWANGAATLAGAVTWGSGATGVTGVVSAANSLVGSAAGDQVGSLVIALNNGNFVVSSITWNDGAVFNVGAVTWCSGTTGMTGAVSAANSLIGSTANDSVGVFVTALSNGNYVVQSSQWRNGTATSAGAATWGSGQTGVSGAVSAANSLVGGKAGDLVGFGSSAVTALINGNYVVRSANWDNGAVANAGAVTWGNGTLGVTGAISAANSLVGSTANDQVGSSGGTALNNGNYVVRSAGWDNGAVVDAGAVTWGSGTIGVSGAVSVANSLVGSTASDQVGTNGVTALSNGNYVVRSSFWDNGAVVDAGAVTWGSGTTGVSGPVSVANSLVGSTASDQVGTNGVTALSNGNYVVRSSFWNNGAVVDAGAVTWGSGTIGVSGAVSSANSLVGSTAGDQIGTNGVTALNNGNYVVRSSFWDNGAATDAGAVTWGNGTIGVIGAVSAVNSLVGSTANDQVGSGGVIALGNGHYVVGSPTWDNGPTANAGAVTLGDGTLGTSGAVTAANSVLGTVVGGGSSMVFTYDLLNCRLIVGYPSGNRVSLFTYTPVIAIALVPEGVRLRFTGVPGCSYTILRAPTVTGPWSTNATPTAPISGLIEHIDTSPPAGSAFYRTAQP